MRTRDRCVLRVFALGAALGVAAGAHAQTNDTTAPAPKNATQKFPYPGEVSAPDAPASAPNEVKRPPGYENETPFVPDNATPPASPRVPETGKTPPAYPGDPEAPQPAGRKVPPAYPGDPGAGPSSSSSSSSDGFSSSSAAGGTSDPGPLNDAGSTGDEPEPDARKHPVVRKKLPKIDPQTPETREAEDLNVAEFYQKSGNFAGAYARAKDAVGILPDDPFAHFALAEAARKMGKSDEAKAEYAQVLKLDPAPKEMKASQKALAEFSQAKR